MATLAVRDLVHVRTALREYLIGVLAAIDRPSTEERTVRYGPRPVRILFVGEGAVAGYGVTSVEHALDGALAEAVHDRTGRGVIVTNRSVPNIRLLEVADSMGSARALTFDVVVWAPTYLEVTERLTMGSWRRDLTALVLGIHAASEVRVVLLQLPFTTGGRPVAVLARRWLPRINRVIQQVAASVPGTAAVAVQPAKMSGPGEAVPAREYYRKCAALLLPAVLGDEYLTRTA